MFQLFQKESCLPVFPATGLDGTAAGNSAMTDSHEFGGDFTPLSYASRKIGAPDIGEIYHERFCITRLD
jgi:hypothetical protein